MSWLDSSDTFLIPGTRQLVSLETGLHSLLHAACLLSDLNSLVNEDWDALGLLEASVLRGNEDDLLLALVQWASQCAVELEELLPPLPIYTERSLSPAGSLLSVGARGADVLRPESATGPQPAAEPPGTGPEPADLNEEPDLQALPLLNRDKGKGRADDLTLDEEPPELPPQRIDKGKRRAYEPVRDVEGATRQGRERGKGKGRAEERARPAQPYMAAARDVTLNRSHLNALVAETAGPSAAAERPRVLALERFSQQEQQQALNQKAREESRTINQQRYGSKVKPPAPRAPQMVAVPSLPTPLELPTPDETPEPQGQRTARRRKRDRPVEVQDMAYVADRPPKAPRKAPAPGRRPARTKTSKQQPSTASAKATLPRNKRPRPSAAKRNQGGDSEESEAVSSDPEPDTPPQPSPVAKPTRSLRNQKRPRRSTETDVGNTSEPGPASSRRPVSKRQRVEVLVSHHKPLSTARPKPRPRMVRRRKADGPVASGSGDGLGPDSPRRSARLNPE